MTKKQKRLLTKIIVSAIAYLALLLASHLFPVNRWVQLAGYLAIYLYLAWNILQKAWKNVLAHSMLDENFLMAIASLGAFVLGEYSEAVAVILFYQVGEWFQSYAVDRSRKSISDLMDIRPDYANLEADGTIRQVDPEEVKIGDTIVIKPGERVPLDGIVLKGDSSLDTAALTGESVPRSVHPGSEVISGCINQSGLLSVKVTKDYAQSTVTRILDLVENATDKKAESEKFITKFARYYTPIVVFSAIVLAIIPSLMTGNWNVWVYRALEFLVISCPCALVISVPMSFFGGIGGASRAGILVKGSNYLEMLSEVTTMVFDKTGTLTKGVFEVSEVYPVKMDSARLIVLAASAEQNSSHPIARSLLNAAKGMKLEVLDDVQEMAGMGLLAKSGQNEIAVGNKTLMTAMNIDADLPESNGFGTAVYVAYNNQYAGMIEISDQIKEDAKVVLDLLKKEGVKKFVMLTGDHASVASRTATALGIKEYHADLLPQDKVEFIEKYLKYQPHGQKTAFIGDGINDAPVLTMADVGIAMGGLGSDAAIEAADIVLMDDQLDELVTARRISKKTLSIVWQNIIFAIAVKIAILVLGALGIANMWAAVFADVGVAFLCILNAMRALNVKKLNVNAEKF